MEFNDIYTSSTNQMTSKHLIGGKESRIRVFLTGCDGQLGSQILHDMRRDRRFTVRCANHGRLDISDYSSVCRAIDGEFPDGGPDVIVNCAAYTDVVGAEKNRDDAYSVNVNGVRNLGVAAFGRKGRGKIRLVHFSTDYLFGETSVVDGDGRKTRFGVDAVKCPTTFYGQTKMWGECNVLREPEYGTVFRIGWLYGGVGRRYMNFMSKIAANAVMADKAGDGSIDVSKYGFGIPTPTSFVSRCLMNYLAEGRQTPIVHCVPNGRPVSRAECAEYVIRRLGIPVSVKPGEPTGGVVKYPKFTTLGQFMPFTFPKSTWKSMLYRWLARHRDELVNPERWDPVERMFVEGFSGGDGSLAGIVKMVSALAERAVKNNHGVSARPAGGKEGAHDV